MTFFDPDTVEAFVLVSDLRSFTRAAEVMNTSQAAVSLKLKRLEERVGQRLVERTPRHIRLSAAGENFIAAARQLLAAQHQAALAVGGERQTVRLGITHHIVGPNLPRLLRRVGAPGQGLTLELRVLETRALLQLYDSGALDAVMVLRYDESRRGGEVLARERFAWFSAPDFTWRRDEALPLAMQPEPCGQRAMVERALARVGIAWREAVVGAGVNTVGSAAAAGIAVAAMAARAAPLDAQDVGERLGLPALPSRDVVMHSNLSGPGAAVLRAVAAAYRAS